MCGGVKRERSGRGREIWRDKRNREVFSGPGRTSRAKQDVAFERVQRDGQNEKPLYSCLCLPSAYLFCRTYLAGGLYYISVD